MEGKDHPLTSYVSGAVAGSAATIGSYPFDLVRTVLASQGEPKVFPNMRAAFVGIFRTRGISGLYAGLVPTLVEIVPYAGLQFGTYDMFKRLAAKWSHSSQADGSDLSAYQHVLCGLAAGTLAKTCCHPLDVVKKRFQVKGLARDTKYGARVEETKYKGMLDAIQRIVKCEGLAGLYKGTYPSVVKAAPSAAITFVVYEKASKWLEVRLTASD